RYMCVGMPALIVLVSVLVQRAVSNPNPHTCGAFARRASYALFGSGMLLVALNVLAKKFPEQGIAATIIFSKTPVAVGGAFMLIGLLLARQRDARSGLVEGMAWLGERLSSKRTVAWAALLLAAIVWLPSHLLPLGRWAAQNAAQYQDEARYTRLGLLIRST